ncbi:MAG: DUF1501 domain-containing protein [Bryobacterales bacterium]|nr:DUF1501 domain-containing protein [Bryobacterales bacterium]MDE0265189.1 DUF1501 domain-containing protein [Bryobacterales bacterium]MDE0624358.1 DUF1501 domain-containing protein [Bryobacterales bacterium]
MFTCRPPSASCRDRRTGAGADFGHQAAVDPVTPHDLHATALHLLGLDHTKLTYRHSGRDFRLADVHGTVVQDGLA